MARVANQFERNRERLNVQRRRMFWGRSAVPRIRVAALEKQQDPLSAPVMRLVVGLSDAGGEFGFPARRLAAVAVLGALLSALGLGIGAGASEIVAPGAVVVTLLASARAAASGAAT